MLSLFCFPNSTNDFDDLSASSVQYVKRSDMLLATAAKLPRKPVRSGSKKSAKQRKRVTVIGAPSDFRHNMHVGFNMDSDTAFNELMDTALWTHELGYRLPTIPPHAPSIVSGTKYSPPWSVSSFDSPPNTSNSTTAIFTQTRIEAPTPLPSQSSPDLLAVRSEAPVRRTSTVRRKPVPPLIPEDLPEPEPIVETKEEELTVESDNGHHSSASSSESEESGVWTPAEVDQPTVSSVEVVNGIDSRLRELLEAADLGSLSNDLQKVGTDSEN